MIASVRFPHGVAVTRDASRVEWSPGRDGITRITRGAFGELIFETNKSGVKIAVWPLPGTVVHEDVGLQAKALVSPVVMEMAAEAAKHGQASGPPSADPPPARPIQKSGRVQR